MTSNLYFCLWGKSGESRVWTFIRVEPSVTHLSRDSKEISEINHDPNRALKRPHEIKLRTLLAFGCSPDARTELLTFGVITEGYSEMAPRELLLGSDRIRP
jgi:hypothetical protein